MANGVDLINMTELSSAVSSQVLESISPLVTIFKAVGIAVLVYVIFLIVRAIFRWKTVSKLTKISRDVHQINDKLDVLVKKINKRKKEKKREKIIPY